MKLNVTIVFILIAGRCFAQDPVIDPALLTQKLVASYNSEKDKVTAIFNWIAENIAYYRPEARSNRKGKSHKQVADEIFYEDIPLPSLTERVATSVLKNRRAVCDGYARLFQSLCSHAGIRSQVITGYARTKWEGANTRFKSNHTWNAVCIDGVWWLLDVTWASGFIARSSGEFVRHYDDYYFLSSPEKFIEHHYPDDQRWTLMSDPPAMQEFRYTPFCQKSFNKYGITSFYPARGVIETKVGDTIRLSLEMSDALRQTTVASDSLWEDLAVAAPQSYAVVQPTFVSPTAVSYQFPVNSGELQWLYVMYNNDAVLRYRLQIKKAGE